MSAKWLSRLCSETLALSNEREMSNAAASSSVPVERLPVRFEAGDDWVITLPFLHGGEARVRNVFERVACFPTIRWKNFSVRCS